MINPQTLESKKVFMKQFGQMIYVPQFYQFTFSINHHVTYGEGIYIIGSIDAIGNWSIYKSLRLQCVGSNNWMIKILVPTNKHIQYKYFASNYDKATENNIRWIGDKNETLLLNQKNIEKFNDRRLTLMSFNLRFDNNDNKIQQNWNSRKQNCLKVILDNLPSIVGVQQALLHQRQFLVNNLLSTYKYFGIARDLCKDQECGIFVRKDRFVVIEYGFEWLSETKQPGSIGFDAKLPRYYTHMVLMDVMHPANKLIVINTHLDHIGRISQMKSIQIILDKIISLTKKYQVHNHFLMGDFNANENDHIFDILKNHDKFQFVSLRAVSPQTNRSITFNNFKKQLLQPDSNSIINQTLTIDHIFASLQNYQPSIFDVIKISNKIVSDHFPIICALDQS